MNDSPYEQAIRAWLRAAGPTPDDDHRERVLAYALALHEHYGGDRDILTAAALLVRSDPAADAVEAVETARAALESVRFPTDAIDHVARIAEELSQPGRRPTTMEGRILKDAQALALIGVEGIARTALQSGAAGENVAGLIRRLERETEARMRALELEQSRYQAQRKYAFVRLFLDRLEGRPMVAPLPLAPYVALEGVPGSGKSTQAEMLYTRYRQEGAEPVLVQDPSPWYRTIRGTLDARQRDRQSQLLLLLTDRYINLRFTIEEAQLAGQPVVSDGSYLSSVVYQSGSDWLAPAHVAFLHTLVPQPTHVFVLDLPPEEAARRAGMLDAPADDEEEPSDALEQMARQRERFRSLTRYFPAARVLDAGAATPDELHELIWREVETWDER